MVAALRNESGGRSTARCGITRGALGAAACIALAATALLSLIGCATPGPDGVPDDPSGTLIAREIEEADIIKLQDGFLYVANPFTGMRIIDARDMDNPVLLGRVALGGRTVELFIRGDLAFVFTSADFLQCGATAVGFEEGSFGELFTPDFVGSRLWVIDISDKMNPKLVNQFDTLGFITATRLVGDVIYTSGNLTFGNRDTGFADGVFVDSINIADPMNIVFVQSELFNGNSLDIHVTPTTMYVVGDDPDLADTTLVSYVDITDPAGAIVRRDQFRVPGQVKNRFFVDESNGTFRIVTEEFLDDVFLRVVALYTYDVSDPDAVTRLARLPIVSNESLRAVRFDGNRGYAVTFRFIDPLFVLDLSDPAAPVIAGELEVPGFSTHLVPLGDRLVGIGIDDTNGRRPALALYDVADPANPRQLSRIIVGEPFTCGNGSEATVDEKALRVISDAGLILLPFSTFDDELLEFTDSLQLVQMDRNRLTGRGVIDHPGLVRRADLLNDRVWVLSDLAFQSVNIADLANPSSLATLDFVTDQELLDAGLRECADSARSRGTSLGFCFGGPCGVVGLLPLFVMVVGLVALRCCRPRR